jgi:hypothetical protein
MTAHIVPFPPCRESATKDGGCYAQDRATVTTTTILLIIKQALLARLERNDVDLAAMRSPIEALLREEFFDVQCQAVADRGDPSNA